MKIGFEDWEFWLNATKNGFKVKVIPDILFYYRKHGQTMFHDAMRRKNEILKYMREKHSKHNEVIDVVYPLGNQSIHNNNELKFSLRSLEKHCSGWNNVYLIGERPWWSTGVIHYPFQQIKPKAISILNKIKFACSIPELSEKFLFMNDDHFFLKDMDVLDFEYQYNNKEKEKIIKERNNQDGYKQLVNATFKEFPDANYFDIHKPIIYEKTKFLQMCNEIAFDKYTHGLLIKSTYCHFNNIKGVESKDYILREKQDYPGIKKSLKGADVFSIHDPAVNKDLINFFEKTFPKESKYEL
jgi:hypothetical protein